MKTIRLATVKSTGKKYIVNFLDFRANKVICHGDVSKATQFGATTHTGAVTFPLADVVLAEVVKTMDLVDELFMQNINGQKEAGADIDVRKTRMGGIIATKYIKL
jgi:hypothetical protein